MYIRRYFLGDRGENALDIEQSEKELRGETEVVNEENPEEPPPLEDISEPESEEEENEDEKENNNDSQPEKETIETSVNDVSAEKPKEDDIGKF